MPSQSERQSDRQEPYWVRACPHCKRQLRDSLSTCCHGDYGKTIYCVPSDLHGSAIRALRAIRERTDKEYDDEMIEDVVDLIDRVLYPDRQPPALERRDG